jgi:hypothetical protein
MVTSLIVYKNNNVTNRYNRKLYNINELFLKKMGFEKKESSPG